MNSNLIKPFKYEMPTKIIFGCGVVNQTGKEVGKLGVKKVLIVTDKGLIKAGILSSLEDSLKSREIKYIIYDQVKPNSSSKIVTEGTNIAKEENCKLVIGIGGGSSMDTAKAVAAMVTNQGNIMDYAGIDKIKNQPLPNIVIPTTAGTGSEVTRWAVISDKEKNCKAGIGSFKIMAKVAICDPQLTISLPSHITAETGMDALTHAIESYVCTATQPISEALAEKSISLINKYLRIAVANGKNIEAREGMLMGSLTAALAFNETRLGIAHSWASPLGAYFPISHGLVNSILLPNVMEYNLIGNPEKFARIALLMRENIERLNLMDAARKAVKAVRDLSTDIGLPQRLKEVIDINEEDIRKVANEALQSGNNLVNPRKPTLEDMIKICKNSM
ncbi:MAG: alcohol dehydrogenase [Candidatus Nealsonbacteria bacterium]|nr:MAG: alcohol dehydrogenase [Candidatus Nealsonbacteria bacterium]